MSLSIRLNDNGLYRSQEHERTSEFVLPYFPSSLSCSEEAEDATTAWHMTWFSVIAAERRLAQHKARSRGRARPGLKSMAEDTL